MKSIILSAILLASASSCGQQDEPVYTPSAPITSAGLPSTEPVPVDTPDIQETETVLPDPLNDPQKGSCIIIPDGSNPEAEPAGACRSGTYRIHKRINASTDGGQCRNAPRTTHSYIVKSFTISTRNGIEVSRRPNIAGSYVLCLQKL